MTPDMAVGLARQAIEVTLEMALPLLGVGLTVGVVISVLQTATQLQETTLAFVPKIMCRCPGLSAGLSLPHGQDDLLHPRIVPDACPPTSNHPWGSAPDSTGAPPQAPPGGVTPPGPPR